MVENQSRLAAEPSYRKSPDFMNDINNDVKKLRE